MSPDDGILVATAPVNDNQRFASHGGKSLPKAALTFSDHSEYKRYRGTKVAGNGGH